MSFTREYTLKVTLAADRPSASVAEAILSALDLVTLRRLCGGHSVTLDSADIHGESQAVPPTREQRLMQWERETEELGLYPIIVLTPEMVVQSLGEIGTAVTEEQAAEACAFARDLEWTEEFAEALCAAEDRAVTLASQAVIEEEDAHA